MNYLSINKNSVIENNYSDMGNEYSSKGGGCFLYKISTLIIQESIFYNNQANLKGGAIYISDI